MGEFAAQLEEVHDLVLTEDQIESIVDAKVTSFFVEGKAEGINYVPNDQCRLMKGEICAFGNDWCKSYVATNYETCSTFCKSVGLSCSFSKKDESCTSGYDFGCGYHHRKQVCKCFGESSTPKVAGKATPEGTSGMTIGYILLVVFLLIFIVCVCVYKKRKSGMNGDRLKLTATGPATENDDIDDEVSINKA